MKTTTDTQTILEKLRVLKFQKDEAIAQQQALQSQIDKLKLEHQIAKERAAAEAIEAQATEDFKRLRLMAPAINQASAKLCGLIAEWRQIALSTEPNSRGRHRLPASVDFLVNNLDKALESAPAALVSDDKAHVAIRLNGGGHELNGFDFSVTTAIHNAIKAGDVAKLKAIHNAMNSDDAAKLGRLK